MLWKKVLGLGAAIAIVGSFLAVSTVEAVSISPPILELSVEPGQVVETKVKLINETAEPITQFASTANFSAKDETGTPDFASENERIGLVTWLEVGAGPYTVQPGERLNVPVTITIPSDAPPGGHYAGIFFSAQAPDVAGQAGQVAITSKIATLLLVRVSGVIREAASVVQFSAGEGTGVFSRLPIDFSLRVQNSGNVHVRPTGTVTIRNLLGGTSATLLVNEGQGAVLPTSVRRFLIRWEKVPSAEVRGNFFEEIGAEWRNFAVGPYTAQVDLSYGASGDKRLSSDYRFWVLPWRVLLVGLLFLVLVTILIVVLVKRYNRWIVARAQAKPPPETTPKEQPKGRQPPTRKAQ